MEIKQEVLDRVAELEVQALVEGLEDPELRRNPAFLEKVRKFLAQNKLVTTPETDGVAKVKRHAQEIPVFEADVVVM